MLDGEAHACWVIYTMLETSQGLCKRQANTNTIEKY